MPRRVRRRYIAVKIDGNSAVKKEDIYKAVWNSILRLFGEYGASQTDLRIIDYNSESRQAVLRCSHKALPIVKASIPCVTQIDGRPAAIHISLISGTLKSLKRKLTEQRNQAHMASG